MLLICIVKQLKVLVKDKNTLLLQEDGKAGDYINLAELANVDCSQIEDLIEKGQDKVYEKKLAEFKQLVLTQKEAELNQQKDEYRLSMVEKEKEHGCAQHTYQKKQNQDSALLPFSVCFITAFLSSHKAHSFP